MASFYGNALYGNTTHPLTPVLPLRRVLRRTSSGWRQWFSRIGPLPTPTCTRPSCRARESTCTFHSLPITRTHTNWHNIAQTDISYTHQYNVASHLNNWLKFLAAPQAVAHGLLVQTVLLYHPPQNHDVIVATTCIVSVCSH